MPGKLHGRRPPPRPMAQGVEAPNARDLNSNQGILDEILAEPSAPEETSTLDAYMNEQYGLQKGPNGLTPTAKPVTEAPKKKGGGIFDVNGSAFGLFGKEGLFNKALEGIGGLFRKPAKAPSEPEKPKWEPNIPLPSPGKMLGAGTGGKVFDSKMRKNGQDKRVAMKLPIEERLASDADNEDKRKEILAEARTMESLPKSKNLLGYEGLAKRGESPALVMELGEERDLGGAFEDVRTKGDKDKQDLVTRYLMQGSFQGLSDLHAQDRVHEDIKPDNIFLDGDFTPKIGDFGQTEHSEFARRREGPRGTANFTAPEAGVRGQTKKGDVWSMGETLLRAKHGKESKGSTDLNGMAPARDDSWHANLEGDERYVDFVKKTMAFDPSSRMSAKQAVEHPYLQLTDEEKLQAQGELRRLRPKPKEGGPESGPAPV